MKKIALGSLLSICVCLSAQDSRIPPAKDLVTYKLSKNPIYQKGWIDFNKNGKMDIYEDPSASIENRVGSKVLILFYNIFFKQKSDPPKDLKQNHLKQRKS